MSETWRPVPSAPGYEVSSRGQIRSPRTVLSQFVHPDGHLQLTLGQRHVYAHRIVAEAFLPNPFNHPIVRHLDGDAANNVVENLAWGTHQENAQDTLRHGHHPLASRGECVNGHEYTPENTRVDAKSHRRICRTCDRVRQAATKARRAA